MRRGGDGARALASRGGGVRPAFGILAVAYGVATPSLGINAAALLGVVPLDPVGPVTWLWWHG